MYTISQLLYSMSLCVLNSCENPRGIIKVNNIPLFQKSVVNQNDEYRIIIKAYLYNTHDIRALFLTMPTVIPEENDMIKCNLHLIFRWWIMSHQQLRRETPCVFHTLNMWRFFFFSLFYCGYGITSHSIDVFDLHMTSMLTWLAQDNCVMPQCQRRNLDYKSKIKRNVTTAQQYKSVG